MDKDWEELGGTFFIFIKVKCMMLDQTQGGSWTPVNIYKDLEKIIIFAQFWENFLNNWFETKMCI